MSTSTPPGWHERYQQALPTLTTLLVAFLLPRIARRSLEFWRATQVYESQAVTIKAKKEDANGVAIVKSSSSAARKVLTSLLSFWPLWLELFIFATSGYEWERRSPFVLHVRQALPPGMIFALVTLWSYSWSVRKQFVGVARRTMDVNTNKPGLVHAHYYNLRPFAKSKFYLFVTVFGILPALAFMYVCQHASQPVVTTLIALPAVPFGLAMLRTPMLFPKKASIRSHVYMVTLLVLFSTVFAALAMAIGVGIAYLATHVDWIKSMFESSKSSASSSGQSQSTEGLAAWDKDVVLAQFFYIISSWLWGVHNYFPASLLCIVYRFDLHKAGLTTVTQEEIEQTLAISEEAAIQAVALKEKPTEKEGDHHDDLGRVPVLLNARPLQAIGPLPSTPTFTVARAILIGVQLLGLYANSYIPANINMAVYPRSSAELSKSGFEMAISVYPLLAYPIILLAIPFSVAMTSFWHGESCASGLRRMWTYEEDWNCQKTDESSSSSPNDEQNA